MSARVGWPPNKQELSELRGLADDGHVYAAEMLAALDPGVLASQEAINWYLTRDEPAANRLVCHRCGNAATHFTLDGGESKYVCARAPQCFKITPAANASPPWVIFADKGKSVSVMPAGRGGDVVNVELVPDGVVAEVVRSVNNGRLSVDGALDVFRFHSDRAR